MSIAKTANVYFDTDGTYRIGKDGSNIVITGGDVIAQGLAPIAAYTQANAAFEAANNSVPLLSSVIIPASDTTTTLDLSKSSYFDHRRPSNDVTLSFANASTNATWTYSHVYEVYSTPWSVNAVHFIARSYDLGSFTSTGLTFNTDGTLMYVSSSSDTIYQSDLTEAWNVQTAAANLTQSISSIVTTLGGITFKPDGTMLYAVDKATDIVHQIDLTEAWNVQTYVANGSFSVSAQEATLFDVFLKPDGTMMYVCGTTSDSVNQYSLSEAWNVQTASFEASSNTIGNLCGLFFKDDGTLLYVKYTGSDIVRSYSLNEAWNVQTMSSVISTVSVSDEGGIHFKPDGTILFTNEDLFDRVFAYEVGELATVTLPSGLINSPTLTLTQGYKYEYTFITNDGANTYSIIERTENALA